MRGRSRAGSIKSRRRKPAAPKRGSGAQATRPRSSSAASQDSAIERLNRELAEARQEQTATADVLRIISSSGSLERVFETILENATRICNANFALSNVCDTMDGIWHGMMHLTHTTYISLIHSLKRSCLPRNPLPLS